MKANWLDFPFEAEVEKRHFAALRTICCVSLFWLSACVSPYEGKPVSPEDSDEKAKFYAAKGAHEQNVKTCGFGNAEKSEKSVDTGDNSPYDGYDYRNHILEATEQGGLNYAEEGGARNDFNLNFARIFNCYKNYTQTQGNRKSNQVLIYFNGGLNPSDTVREKAEEQIPLMLEHGFYPIFLIWPTGPLDTYFEQVAYVRNGTRVEDPMLLRAPLNVAGDFGQGLARAPVNYVNQVTRFVASGNPANEAERRTFFLNTGPCDEAWQEVTKARAGADDAKENACTDVYRFGIEGRKVTEGRNLMTGKNPDKKPELTPERVLHHGLVIPRFLSTSLVDAFGKTMWENMVRRTRTTIRRPDEFDTSLKVQKFSEVDEEIRNFPNGIGAFAKFFTMLQACLLEKKAAAPNDVCPRSYIGSARNAWEKVELTVIGHSMGTIVMNELIPLHPNLPYRNLVFMAAAASVRDTTRALSPLLTQAHRDASPLRFYNLMLHPQNDANEIAGYGFAPSGSLLAWIDEMYEGPRTVIDRTMGKWGNLRASQHVFPARARSRMVFRVFNWDRDLCTEQDSDKDCEALKASCAAERKNPEVHRPECYEAPLRHGDFNETAAYFWCPYFWGADKVGWWNTGEAGIWTAAVCRSDKQLLPSTS